MQEGKVGRLGGKWDVDDMMRSGAGCGETLGWWMEVKSGGECRRVRGPRGGQEFWMVSDRHGSETV